MTRASRAGLVGATLLVAGTLLLARSGWARAKGVVGEALIGRALDATLVDGRPRRPWSWADMHPIARLEVPRLHVERAILSNATGSALAFGVGHIEGTAAPGAPGNCALAGHRDAWAEFLKDLRPGDAIVVTIPRGRIRYVAVSSTVVRFDDGRVLEPTEDERLTLVTCWPFRGWLRSPWRYVVRCDRRDAVIPSL